MAEAFVGQILVVGFNFAPLGWAQCQGQLLSISQNTALFSLLGTYYGGDGKSNFALPNLQGSLSVGQGTLRGSGSQYSIGQSAGSPQVTLNTSEMPLHTHNLMASKLSADSISPAQAALPRPNNIYSNATAPLVQMNLQAVSPAGSSSPHNNMMPYLGLNFVIALQGIFPQRQ